MEVVALAKDLTRWSKTSDYFLQMMFHGVVLGRGELVGQDLARRAPVEDPLRLARPGNQIPAVCRPQQNLIVSAALASELARFPGLRALPVRFDRLFHYEYHGREFPHVKEYTSAELERAAAQPEPFVQGFPDCPEYHKTVGRYFEIAARTDTVVGRKFSNCVETVLRVDPDVRVHVNGVLCPEMFLESAMIRCIGGIFVRRDLFEYLEPFLDPDFFRWSAPHSL